MRFLPSVRVGNHVKSCWVISAFTNFTFHIELEQLAAIWYPAQHLKHMPLSLRIFFLTAIGFMRKDLHLFRECPVLCIGQTESGELEIWRSVLLVVTRYPCFSEGLCLEAAAFAFIDSCAYCNEGLLRILLCSCTNSQNVTNGGCKVWCFLLYWAAILVHFSCNMCGNLQTMGPIPIDVSK